MYRTRTPSGTDLSLAAGAQQWRSKLLGMWIGGTCISGRTCLIAGFFISLSVSILFNVFWLDSGDPIALLLHKIGGSSSSQRVVVKMIDKDKQRKYESST